ncbi:MAG: HAD hydrolase family protein [Oscillospiraceae bacterium]
MNEELWKFIKFNISVVITSALDIFTYLFLIYRVFDGIISVPLPDNAVLSLLGIKYRGYLFAYLISTCVGYIAAYLINRKITFHSNINPVYSSVMYLILALFNILISSYIGGVFGSFLEINNMSNPITEAASKFIIINIPTLWTYPLERYVIQINKKEKAVKYIATDLDGTLLSSSTEVSWENLEAIKRLSEKGISTVLLTGRTLYEVPAELRENTCVKYIVFRRRGRLAKRKGFIKYDVSADTAREIFNILSEYETFIEVYSDGTLVEGES